MSVWISRREDAAVAAECAVSSGPLAGMRLGVKDNIDVAGLPTTCACPAFAYAPTADAVAVARLRAAGATVVGKTNLDQFATGLVGTRSPYGAVADPRRPDYVSGGSSSGSAVAVSTAEVQLALGTDTAGSGRVPAAFCGVYGLKASVGAVPVGGVVPACRSFDCVSIFAAELELGLAALAQLVDDPAIAAAGRPAGAAGAADAGGAAGARRLGTFGPDALSVLCPDYAEAFERVRGELAAGGMEIVEIDAAPFLAAGALLYGGAFLAERVAAVGDFIAEHHDDCDPTVASIVLGAAGLGAADYVRDQARLAELAVRCDAQMDGLDGLMLPTVPFQPTLAEVAADPVGVNTQLGVFTTFANLLGLPVMALPAGMAGTGQFGISLLGARGGDVDLAALARRVDALLAPARERIPLLVVGAHLRGMPLHRQLTDLGARFLAEVITSPEYRLYALDTEPAKPGLLRSDGVGVGGEGGSIAGELYGLTPSALGRFLAALPQPMCLGRVRLADGAEVVGFLTEPVAVAGAREITELGGWRNYLAAV
ncbi:MAG TPA: allophanate hydrolase [Solirubrobacteraceae bacterium]|nr:allophanate hydrolase [Solirubrobacteraceae bacterium]